MGHSVSNALKWFKKTSPLFSSCGFFSKFEIMSKEKESRAVPSRAALFIKEENISKQLPKGEAPLARLESHAVPPAAEEAGKVSLYRGKWALPTEKKEMGRRMAAHRQPTVCVCLILKFS